MKGKWLVKNVLWTLNELVRIELGPQLVELDCTDENLKNEVTAAHYHVGARDALGRVIRPREAGLPSDDKLGVVEKGQKMVCVDWDARHKPKVWKIYQNQDTEVKDMDGNPVRRFIQVGEEAAFDVAEAIAVKLARTM